MGEQIIYDYSLINMRFIYNTPNTHKDGIFCNSYGLAVTGLIDSSLIHNTIQIRKTIQIHKTTQSRSYHTIY
jgi:hypothetical protein